MVRHESMAGFVHTGGIAIRAHGAPAFAAERIAAGSSACAQQPCTHNVVVMRGVVVDRDRTQASVRTRTLQDSRRRTSLTSSSRRKAPAQTPSSAVKEELRSLPSFTSSAPLLTKFATERDELRELTLQAAMQEYLSNQRVQTLSKQLLENPVVGHGAQDTASEARNTLVVSHMRLVVRMARKCASYFRLPLMDLVQEGCLGLMHAARKFDPSRGTSFAAYASPWIMHYMRRAEQNQAGMIRLPVHVFEKRSAIQQTAKTLALELGRSPTVSEIAQRLETPLEESLIRSTLENSFDVRSLDSPLVFHLETSDSGLSSASSSVSAASTVRISEADMPDMRVLEQERSELLSRFLREQLTSKEHAVLCMRYGLDGHEHPRSVTEVAEAFGVSLSAVTQTLTRATRKLQACRDSLQTTIG
ncbi:RNA polymerase sigma factor RpoD [Porphyridium purpureum]|uniref:RNA polymerase sigma factor RpoD n=1 Tax=Porphyridium purpureum TaxID=35688 RepID=A0A5J4Z079_PORPP|nr:RNA polymerase sigma factor RpoD [Porphyridium purpureum]|eukprot:POR5549..scf208_2